MSSLLEVWNSAASSPFQPTIGKNNQLLVGSVLLFGGLWFDLLSNDYGTDLVKPFFWLVISHWVRFCCWFCPRSKILTSASRSISCERCPCWCPCISCSWVCRNPRILFSVRVLIFLSFGAVYTICAVGVYVWSLGLCVAKKNKSCTMTVLIGVQERTGN